MDTGATFTTFLALGRVLVAVFVAYRKESEKGLRRIGSEGMLSEVDDEVDDLNEDLEINLMCKCF